MPMLMTYKIRGASAAPSLDPPRAKAKSGSPLCRGLTPQALGTLAALTQSSEPHWWKDLLGLWRPSGTEAGPDGLRLAVRNNYLNFYRQGQSVAKVGFARGGRPILAAHVKYVFGKGETAQRYAKLTHTEVVHPAGGAPKTYRGLETLQQWVANAVHYTGEEKAFVDAVVAANGAVIDLEMALPASAERASPIRIDLVALEEGGAGLSLALWEAKLIGDARLRSRTGQPKLLAQLAPYEAYLAQGANRESVVAAYRQACVTLVELHGMAAGLADIGPLHPKILSAAHAETALALDPKLRLLLLADQAAPSASWAVHAEVLRRHGVSSLTLSPTSSMRLARPEVGV